MKKDLISSSRLDSYNASSIEILEGLEPVRKRPGMYIGGTDERALHHLISEILDNSMDEAVAGFANRIEVELNSEFFSNNSRQWSRNSSGTSSQISKQKCVRNYNVYFTFWW
tara:strand:- start:808 stop:1143 length:336 start_codon:yes stop_codon:yes gene_type:complete